MGGLSGVDMRHTRLAVRGVEGVAVSAGQNESRCSAGDDQVHVRFSVAGPCQVVKEDCRYLMLALVTLMDY